MPQNHFKPETRREKLLSSLPVVLPTVAVILSAVTAALLLHGHYAESTEETLASHSAVIAAADEETEMYVYDADENEVPESEAESIPDDAYEDTEESALSDTPAQHGTKDRVLSAGETKDAAELVDSYTSIPLFATGDEIVEQRVREQLALLEDYFPDGMYWNHVGVDTSKMTDEEIALCVTNVPCDHSAYGYGSCNIYNGLTDDFFPQYGDEMQCLGYASLISDLLFGCDTPITEFYDFDKLRIGDHIRMGWYEHSMIVTDIDRDTETITVTEVNADYESCEISWGRQITRDELESMEGDLTYYTRYAD